MYGFIIKRAGIEKGEGYRTDQCGNPPFMCARRAHVLINRVVPNGTLRGVEGEGQISPIRLRSSSVQLHIGLLTASEKCKY